MLVSLKLTCWRQHRERTFNFTPGLNAVRGANEGGKTGMLLAIVYALFGVKAMPQPLAELVTWGCPVKDLEVVLIKSIRGELYEFKRSESGAECKHSGGIVVGQNEVTKFAEELLGVSRQFATNMMFASQRGLRGALDDGPKSLSEYIETLSGMDLFDRLMEAAQSKLNTGPTKTIDNEIEQMQSAVDALDLTPPNVDQQNAEVSSLSVEVRCRQEDLAGANVRLQGAETALADAKAQYTVRHNQGLNILKAKETLKAQDKLVVELTKAAAEPDMSEAISGLESDLNGVQGVQAQASAYKAFLALPAHPDLHWEGDAESLAAEMRMQMNSITQSDVEKAELMAKIREAKAKRVNASACGYCGKDFSDVPEVAFANAKIDTDVAQWTKKHDDWVAVRADSLETHGTLRAVQESAKPFNDFLTKYAEYVDADRNLVPAKITWKGEPPQALPDVDAMKDKLSRLKAAQWARSVAGAKLEQAQATLAEYREALVQLEATLPPMVDIEAVQKQADVLRSIRDAIVTDIANAEKRILIVEGQKTAMFFAHAGAKQRLIDLSAALESKKVARADLIFNNNLIRKIRAARPMVASRLWEVVLASVSSMFSKVRGVSSKVARSSTGFTVNGYPVAGLSGSALDVLGMALRVALIKSFVPDCSFLILDEPMAACDDDRTAAMLGFLATCDFQQTILITHESLSEANAANLILI